MTGYGQAGIEKDGLSLQIEVKTLNSKGLDVHMRIPKGLSSKEADIRNKIAELLQRGKVQLSLDMELNQDQGRGVVINEKLFKQYYKQLQSLSSDLEATASNLFELALQMPGVYESPNEEEQVEEVWPMVYTTITEALLHCDQFRIDEGRQLEASLQRNLDSIREELAAIKNQDQSRLTEIRKRLRSAFDQWESKEKVDENRFEQELIYYLEKLDINEEKVRLQSHLDYFQEMLAHPESQGKKLQFISQEIGREINTIGSKANDANIQKRVVQMKDDLEQMKEQLANVL
jgi:uncharacterized protein (TIGR00255 family)